MAADVFRGIRIVEVATAILDAEGLDALSTRRLAHELGVRAPSLYNHFGTKEEILDAVGDAIIAQVDLGMWNTPIALIIATIKAVLVILFFMHVIHSTRLTWVVVIGAFLWLGVLFVLTFADYLTRLWNLT